jgi:hypothetical protein
MDTSCIVAQGLIKKNMPIGTAVFHYGECKVMKEVYFIVDDDSDMVLCYPTNGGEKFFKSIKSLN